MKLDLKIKTYVNKNFSKDEKTSGDKLAEGAVKGMALGAGAGIATAPLAAMKAGMEADKNLPEAKSLAKKILKADVPDKSVKLAKSAYKAGNAVGNVAKFAKKGLVAGLAVGAINAVRSKSKSESKDK